MNDEDLLADLLLRWEDLREQGRNVGAADLCTGHPHLIEPLARRIEALRGTSWMERPPEADEDAEASPSIPSPPVPVLAGRYRLDVFLAEGGFAQVWQGFDLELQRAVAVKMPRASRIGSADDFLAEARRVARLKHPGIVPVYDVGREGDLFFIVAEFVEGGSLAERLGQGPVDPRQACRWLAEIAGALDYAHRQGVIHRDVKPANILLDHHGRAQLADFGIALSARKSGRFAPSLGTLATMAPEQLAGKPLDGRSDIYSLGVVLCRLLTGALPYNAEDDLGLRKEIAAGAVRLREGPYRLSPKLRALCLKCLALDPGDRFATAGELAEALGRSGADGSARPYLAAAGIGLALLLASFPLWRTTFERPAGLQPGPNQPGRHPAKVLGTIGSPAVLKLPIGVAEGPDGTLHVANTGFSAMRVFARDGTDLGSYGEPGRGEGQIEYPQFPVLSPEGVAYVTDFGRGVVLVYGADRGLRSTYAWPVAGTTRGGPRGLGRDRKGRLFVVDQKSDRVLVLDPRGNLLFAFGSEGPEEARLKEPTGLALTAEEVFVADTGNGRIAVYDHAGKFRRCHEEPAGMRPFAVSVGTTGNMFVSDHEGRCVRVLDPRGKLLGHIDRGGKEFLPMGSTILADGSLAVVDYPGHCVRLYGVEAFGNVDSGRKDSR